MRIDLFTVYDAILAGGQARLKLQFDPLGTAITPLQRGRFPKFATTLNSFIDTIHSTKNKAFKEGKTSVNSNYKYSHVASNFMVIYITLIRRVCMES